MRGSTDQSAASETPTNPARQAAGISKPRVLVDVRQLINAPRRDLRHHDDVAGAQLDVLLERLAAHNCVVVEFKRFLLRSCPAQNTDVVKRGKRCSAASHAKRLDHVDSRVDDELTGPVDLPDDVYLVAADLTNRDGHDRVRDVFGQALGNDLLEIGDGLAPRIDLAYKRKGERPVWGDEHRALQIRFLPNRDLVCRLLLEKKKYKKK